MTAAMAAAGRRAPTQVRGAALTFQSLFFVGLLLFLITLSSTWSPTASCAGSGSSTRSRWPLATPAATGPTAARRSVADQLTKGGVDVGRHASSSALLLALARASALLVLVVAAGRRGRPAAGRVLTDRLGGLPHRDACARRPTRPGVFQGLVGSFWIGVFVVVLAFPLGIGAAIYLEEYAPTSRFTRFIDMNIRNLAGVPSVVYGILGFAIFVKALEDVTGGRTAARSAAGITLAILVLPIVIITVGRGDPGGARRLREAGFGVGATRWEVDPQPRAALRRARDPHRHGAVAGPGPRRGGAADPRRRDHRPPRRRAGASLDLSQLHERFTAMPIVDHHLGQAARRRASRASPPPPSSCCSSSCSSPTPRILLRNRYEKKR